MKKCLIVILFFLIPTSYACTITFAPFFMPPQGINQAQFEKKFQVIWPSTGFYRIIKEATHCTPVLKLYSNVPALVNAVVHKKVDLAYLKDFPYFQAYTRLKTIKPVAVAMSPNRKTKKPSYYYQSFLISLASNTKFKTLRNLKGATVGFLSPTSTSGYRLPYAFLVRHGINPKTTFKKIIFFNNHDDDLYKALLDKKVDVVATWGDVILRNKAVKLNVLMNIKHIPNPPILAVTAKAMKYKKVLGLAFEKEPCKFKEHYSNECFRLPPKNFYTKLFEEFKSLPDS